MADSTLVLSSPGAMTNPYPEAPVYTPKPSWDITSGLLFAYDANTLTPGAMSTWAQSGGSRTDGNLSDMNATASRRPVAVAGVLNGQTVARFTAANQQYARTPTAFPGGGPNVSMPSTQAFLFRPATLSGTVNILTGGTAAGASRYLATGVDGNTGTIQIGGGVVGELKANRAIAIGEWQVVVSVFDGAASRIYINGVLVGSGPVGVAAADSAYLPRLTVGANTGANTQYFDGDISKISIFGRAFTNADAAALTSSWKLAANLT